MIPALLEALLAPISPEQPAGGDMSYSQEFDEIRRLRKGDDPSLSQGEWVREIRAPQWPAVRNLCETMLTTKTKDLQIACWYAEALTNIEGLPGLTFGLKVLDGLAARFWETCFPAFDPSDLEERIAKFEWLNTQLPLVINNIPMTSPKAGGYSRLKWVESRFVENLGVRDLGAKEEAIREGKLSGETFDKAVSASGQGFYLGLFDQAQAAQAAFKQLEQTIDHQFGPDAPSLGEVKDVIQGCLDLVGQIMKRFGLDPNVEASASAITVNLEHSTSAAQPTPMVSSASAGPVQSRADAIRRLREIAKYFRDHEPHSPVGPLVERAARWGDMPLDEWLTRVIKDESTLGQLRDLLDLRTEI